MRAFGEWFMVLALLVACNSGGGGAVRNDDAEGGIAPSGDTGVPNQDSGGMADASPRDARVIREAAPPPPDCGDNDKTGNEECDDGNVEDIDGCSSQCTKEAGFNCPAGPGACAPICGDGRLVLGEACDDANVVSADGCTDSCQLESGWVCVGSGQACTSAGCGDGVTVGAEACDDANMINGDGCSITCTVEAGWLCPVAGMSCVAERCGDGVRAGTEVCDDGNISPGDGCTGACSVVEPNFWCPDMGGTCSRTSVWGNGVLTSDEQCDDKNTKNGDGCSSTGTLEAGYQCLTVGRACTAAACGDGIIAGAEQCEDGNNTANDGCTACKVDSGWACAVSTGQSVCHAAVCGDKVVEGDESCDDGNTIAGDGCSPPGSATQCKFEPTCTVGQACTSQCGDGIRLPTDTTEECDDGNAKNGDGCSSTCKKEAGYACRNVISALPNSFPLTVTYRDFIAKAKNGSAKHPDFEIFNGADASLGLVGSTLVGGKPSYTGLCEAASPPAMNNCGGIGNRSQQTTSSPNFGDWYTNDSMNTRSRKLVTTMVMNRVGTTTEYRNATFGQQLLPLDNQGWVSAGQEDTATGGVDNRQHNFGFTTEIHYWFKFQGGEVLTFAGDDDVWVFIAGNLALDLGGLHESRTRTITLNANGTVSCQSGNADCGTKTLPITIGNVYEVALFHAERHSVFSNFDLTLNGFTAPMSVCTAVCGDGVVTSGEVCDDGSACSAGNQSCTIPQAQRQPVDAVECTASGATCNSKNDGAYGHCIADCQNLGPHCGDSTKQSSEQCDNGYRGNTGSYNGCTADCVLGPMCGDARVDGFYGEQCDLGASGNLGGYGGCSATCKFSERCGDGMLQPDREQCDDTLNRSAYGGCGPGCKLAPFCGDGVVQGARGEQCDLGTAMNTGAYGGCRVDCKKASRCGDKVVDQGNGEQCDDGNRNNFDGCSRDCTFDAAI